MKHLDEERLSALLDGALEEAARSEAERHLAGCAVCRDALAALAALDRELRPMLEHDPGEAYFEEFAARVGGRLRAEGLKGAQARERPGRWLAEWFRSPRKLALLSAVATLVAGAGIVMLSTREVRFPLLRGHDLEGRNETPTATLEAAPAPGEAPPPAGASAPLATSPGSARRGSAAPADRTSDQAQAELAAPTSGAVGAPTLQQRERGSSAAPVAGAVSGAGTETSIRGEGAPQTAAPSRARQVRRDERGEDVAVGPSSPFPRTPPTRSFVPAAPGEPTRVAKQNVAEPLQSTTESEEKAGPVAAPAPAARERGLTEAVKTTAPIAARTCGTVVDEAGRPVGGANVVDPASGASASTAADGSFCLEGAPDEVRVLAIGFQPTARAARPGARLRIALTPVSVMRRPAGGPSPSGRSGSGSWDLQPTWIATHGRNAQRLTALAERVKVAPAWDSAAAEWALTLEGASGGPLGNEARYQLARARWMAWRLDPTAKRAATTRAALEGFLQQAPRGAPRDSAEAWSRVLGR